MYFFRVAITCGSIIAASTSLAVSATYTPNFIQGIGDNNFYQVGAIQPGFWTYPSGVPTATNPGSVNGGLRSSFQLVGDFTTTVLLDATNVTNPVVDGGLAVYAAGASYDMYWASTGQLIAAGEQQIATQNAYASYNQFPKPVEVGVSRKGNTLSAFWVDNLGQTQVLRSDTFAGVGAFNMSVLLFNNSYGGTDVLTFNDLTATAENIVGVPAPGFAAALPLVVTLITRRRRQRAAA